MIEGAFGPVTERLQSGVSAQEVVLVLHSVRRKHSLLLLEVKVRNKNWLQSMLDSQIPTYQKIVTILPSICDNSTPRRPFYVNFIAK